MYNVQKTIPLLFILCTLIPQNNTPFYTYTICTLYEESNPQACQPFRLQQSTKWEVGGPIDH